MNEGKLNFVLIGPKGSGKTLFLTSLFAKSSYISAKNAHTIDYLKPLSERVIGGKLPEATASRMVELSFSYQSKKYSIDFFIDDYDGYFVESLHEKYKTTLEERTLLLNHIKYSNGIIFLFSTEKEFLSNSIRNFKYEVDTFINSIKDIYKDYKKIPIPAVIAVTKWDKSQYFQDNNEEKKAIEYIEYHDFLNEIRLKIENFFSFTKVIPVSSIYTTNDDDIEIKPYNIEKPIEFFLDINYELWEKKIELLIKEHKEDELFKFLHNVVYDMRFYRDGKYIKLYEKIEEERFNQLYSTIKESHDSTKKLIEYLSYSDFNFLKDDSKNTINKLIEEKKLKDKNIEKYYKTSFVAIFVLFIAIFIIKYYKNKEDIIFSKINEYYKSNNYDIAIKDIDDYLQKYNNNSVFGFYSQELLRHKKILNELRSKMFSNINEKYQQNYSEISKINNFQKYYVELKKIYEETKEKNYLSISKIINDRYIEFTRVMKAYSELSSIINNGEDVKAIPQKISALQEYSLYEDIKKIIDFAINIQQKNTLMTNVYEILSSNQIEDAKVIDKLINKMISYKVGDKETIDKLLEKKKSLKVNKLFDKFLTDIKNKDFENTSFLVKENWNENYTDDNREKIIKLLNDKLNLEIDTLLNEINFNVTDDNEFTQYKQKLLKIKELLNLRIYEINFTPQISEIHKDLYKKYKDMMFRYQDILNNGIIPSISFGTSSQNGDNEPLGFECDSLLNRNSKIIVEINDNIYNYTDSISCTNNTMVWEGFSPYKAGNYNITIKEMNFFNKNSLYKSSFELTMSDIFRIYNNGSIKVNIGDSYYLIFRKQ